jgi:pimeloyl-ACP methyl ester carboxylesterase
MWLDFDIARSDLARISAPTLVMGVDHDLIPVWHTVEIWNSIPGTTLCIAPGATHFWASYSIEVPILAD